MSRDRLALVARLGPVGGAGEEVAGGLRLPCEVAALVHHHHRPAAIGRVVGAEPELAARLELGRDQVERAVVDHAPLGVARLGPGIGVQQIEERQRAIGNAAKHV